MTEEKNEKKDFQGVDKESLAELLHDVTRTYLSPRMFKDKKKGEKTDWSDLPETDRETYRFMARHVMNNSARTAIMNDFSFVKKDFVFVNGSDLLFRIQDGPIKENGVNGCQVDALIEVAKEIIVSFNDKIPCAENENATSKLADALDWLERRKKNREKYGVEGIYMA